MQTAIHFSRFPDSLTPGASPLPDERPVLFSIPADPDMVSIHASRLEPGRYIVIEWARCPVHRFRQLAATNVASLQNGREYVPPGAELRYVGPWGEAWVVRRGRGR